MHRMHPTPKAFSNFIGVWIIPCKLEALCRLLFLSDPVSSEKPETSGGKSGKGGSKSSRRSDRNDNNVVGLGDHLPEFIALSFEERRAS